LCDYRDIGAQFDRVVSVGMFEHVGLSHYGSFFNRIAALLKPDGVALLHAIGRSHP
jgi:cyclopropane-fatty-acyl-phospholipid synthase